MGFPGLIGNYPDHLLDLCMHYPEVRSHPISLRIEIATRRTLSPPAHCSPCPPASLPEDYRKQLKGRLAPPKADSDFSKETAPEERYLSAMGVTLANWVSWMLLKKFKIPVDMMTGQSQGEMAAICAVGASDFHETAPSFWKVLDVDTRDSLGGRLAFAWATGERIEKIVADYPGTYVAIYMAPTGTIFGGDREGLEKICELLRKEQVLVQILPYPPIHTPALSKLKPELMQKLNEDDYELAPHRSLSIPRSLHRFIRRIRRGSKNTLCTTSTDLRIWQTVQRMYHDGARVFVQVGGGHMAAHLEILLPEDAEPVVTAATDTDTRNPLTQLCHLCATLFTAGVSLDLSPLFDYRHVRSLDFDEPVTSTKKKGLQIPLRIDWMPLYSENVPPKRHVMPTTSEAPSNDVTTPSVEPTVVEETTAEPSATRNLRSLLPFDEATLSRLPVLGEVLAYEPGVSITVRRVLSLETDPYLGDHLFVYAPPKSLLEQLPVLPMTMSLEFTAEVASLLSPGEGLIGMENIRATKWIGLKDTPTEEIFIDGKVISFDHETGVRRIEVKFTASNAMSFSAVALFRRFTETTSSSTSSIRAKTVPGRSSLNKFTPNDMFHGPAFHVLTELDTFGNPGASAKLEVLPKDRAFSHIPDPILLTDPFDGWDWSNRRALVRHE